MENNILDNSKKINKFAIATLFILVAQYILGMYTTFFVEMPDGVSAWGSVSKSIILMLHIILGCLMPFLSIHIIFSSIKSKDKSWIIYSSLGLLFVIISLFSGSFFMEGESDIYSFIMAIGLGLSLLSYSLGIYSSKK